jgi:raffinose/stachyose/melibiose transport system substrate-binding protein
MKMKRLVSVVLATTIIASVFVGCGSKSSTETTPNSKAETTSEASAKPVSTTITLGMHVANTKDQEPVTYNIVQKFMEANPDIKVEIQGNDKDEHVKKMKMAAQSNELPDVFWMDSSVAPELNDAGLLLDLNDFLKTNTDVAKAIPDNMKEASMANGIQYGLPYQALVTGIWYNKEIFKKFGVEEPVNGTTYEKLLEAVKTFKKNGIVPISKGAKDTYSVWAFLIAFERYGYFDKIDSILAGKEKFNNPEFLKYFKKLAELGKNGAFPSNAATLTYFQAKEQFTAGKSAMFDSGMWDAGALDGTLGDKTGFWWGPTFSDTDKKQTVKMKVSSAPLCVSKKVGNDEAKKAAVYKFLAYYFGQDAAKISYEGSIIPATNYQVDLDLSKKPAFAAIVKALNDQSWTSPKAQPDLVLKEAVQAQLYDSMYGTMIGTYKPEEALKKIDDVLSQQ